MIAMLAILQASLGPVPSLDVAHRALQSGDTAAAVTYLESLVEPDTVYTGEEIAALLVLKWIGRGTERDQLQALWDRSLQPVRVTTAATWSLPQMLMFLMRELVAGHTDIVMSAALAMPGVAKYKALSWQPRLRSAADTARGEDPLVVAAANWVATLGWLANLDRFSYEVPALDVPLACQNGCLLRRTPPPDLPLLHRFRATDAPALDTLWTFSNRLPRIGRTATFDSLWASIDDVSSGPWPFNEFAERLRVTVCVLVRYGSASLRCSPHTEHLDPATAAELRAVGYEFQGRRGLAQQVMTRMPAPFVALDTSIDLLFADSITVSRPSGPERVMKRVPVPTGPAPAWFWRAAWPLYLEPYNERLIAHRGRLLLADMSRRLVVRWDDLNLFGPYGDPGTLVRIGVPMAVARPRGSSAKRFPLVLYTEPGTHETLIRARSPMDSVPLDFALVARDTGSSPSISGFVAEDYTTFSAMDHQAVRYKRSDRAQIDVYTQVVAPFMCASSLPILGFFLLDSQLQELSKSVDLDPMDPPRLKRFHLELSPGSYVYSLELLDRPCRRAERARYVLTVPAPGGWNVSDLMLADELYLGDDRWVTRVKERPPLTVRPSLTLAGGTVARFYWEMYGVGADTMEVGRLRVSFEVVNVDNRRAPVREIGRLAERARSRAGTLDISYDLGVPPGDEPLGFGLAVGIPEGTEGIHVARVRVMDAKTGKSVTAERAFFVRE